MINNKMIESQASKIRGYYRIKNNHVFVQCLSSNELILSLINSISKIENQNIHIFDLNPLLIKDLIEMIIDIMSYNKIKVIIYIPKIMKDYKTIIEDYYKNDNKLWKIAIYSKPVIFIDSSNITTRKLEISCLLYQYNYIIRATNSYITDNMMSRHFYEENGIIFDTVLKRKYPELFKDKIIKKFKKHCPNSILTTIKNDEDIWNFIMDKNDDGGE